MTTSVPIVRLIVPVVLAAVFLLTIGCATEYQQGYRQGQKEAREAKQEFGPLAKPGHRIVEGLGIDPSIDGKSKEWNRGYRQGIRDEFQDE